MGSIFGLNELDKAIKDSNARLDQVEPGVEVSVNQDGVGASVSVGSDKVRAEAEVRKSLTTRATEWAARLRFRW